MMNLLDNYWFCLIYLTFLFEYLTCQDEIDEFDKLFDNLKNNGPNARVGFLTVSNYESVKRILPPNTKAVFVEHENDLTQMVLNDTLIAALVTGMPEEKYHKLLHIFSSKIITLHSIFMAPDKSNEFPHGVESNFSTKHLSIAINAAITRVQANGIDEQLAIKNTPKDIVFAHTCKDDQAEQFEVPNKKDAQGLLKVILETGTIKVLAIGPSDWGNNDGNYLRNPPIGFYPDYLEAIVEQFKNLSGPDKELYGSLKIERVWINNYQVFPWHKLFDGTAHITEPYFIIDSTYKGSGKQCTNDKDCFDADLPNRKETCNSSKICVHPTRSRLTMLRTYCNTVASDSKFFTKRISSKKNSKYLSKNFTVSITLIILFLITIVTLSLSFIAILIYKKKIDRRTLYTLFK